jgi:hypothetical protein
VGFVRRALVLCVLLLPILTGCSAAQDLPSAGDNVAGNAAAPSPRCTAWGCEQDARFAAAVAFVAAQKGHLGIIVKDRVSGAVWRAGESDFPIWAGSTPKLAFTVALREQAAAGRVKLSTSDQAEIARMLSVSDNNAADDLWDRYANGAALMTTWQKTYGMSTATYVNGFPARWGFVKCTSQDLVNLMSYILDKLGPADRQYIVDGMRTVGPPQQWGVWGAGQSLRPGVKDGWSVEKDDKGTDHWITATVGFVGPDERYVVGAMYDQIPGIDSIEAGVHVLTDLVATVFGAPVPAPAVIPDDY